MINAGLFKDWLTKNTSYSSAVINDLTSRMKRADGMVSWEPTTTYLYTLEQNDQFKKLSVSVRSQLRKAVKCYTQFVIDNNFKRK